MKNPKRLISKAKFKRNDPAPADITPPAVQEIPDPRQLKDLVSVSPSTLKDFESLGIKTVVELARHEPKELYRKLCKLSKNRHDICTEDVFSAAIAQAKNPKLAPEKCDWWYWNRRRQRIPKARPPTTRSSNDTATHRLPSEEVDAR